MAYSEYSISIRPCGDQLLTECCHKATLDPRRTNGRLSFRALIFPFLNIQGQAPKAKKELWREGKGSRSVLMRPDSEGRNLTEMQSGSSGPGGEGWTGKDMEPSEACSKVTDPQLGAAWWVEWVPSLSVQSQPSDSRLVGVCIFPHLTASSSPLFLDSEPPIWGGSFYCVL